MIANLAGLGVRVPNGFATTADAYRRFIGDTGLADVISTELAGLDTDDVQKLARAGKRIREAVVAQPFPADLEADIRAAYDHLTVDGLEELARQALTIESHYGRPMDIEWGKDGQDGELYILQARPETVKSRQSAGSIQRYRIGTRGTVLIEGRAIGQKIGAGAVRVLSSVEDMHRFARGEVLVADMTDPDWNRS